MPWLYSGPDDSVCQLRGVGDEGDEDAGAPDASEATAGPANPDAPPRKFWDGSRDRWISAVSARVHPDAVIAAPAPVDADALCLLGTCAAAVWLPASPCAHATVECGFCIVCFVRTGM